MHAMLLQKIGALRPEAQPLTWSELPMPKPGPGEVLLRVSACGVCHTELDIIEGRTPPPRLPVILGHQVVGRVAGRGPGANRFPDGERVGVAWIFSACGECPQCLAGRENLCPQFCATGRDAHGGYAEWMTAPQDFVYPIPAVFSDAQAAPLLCAGAIGFRSLRLTGLQDGQALGLTGFGASAHLVLLLALRLFPNTPVYVFSRNPDERRFALELGAAWAGPIGASPARLLDAIIDTTPVWKPVVEALAALAPGGRLVINAIRKQTGDQNELLRLDYPAHLWMEKEIKSVANVSRDDVRRFLEQAASIPILPEFQEYALQDANRALLDLKAGRIRGAKVLQIAYN